MSDNTKIEWSDATWNPVTGCTEVSPGCDHCYAKTFAERWRGTPGHHFENGFDLTLRPERLEQPLKWKKPRRIFVNSMSDLFHEGIPEHVIADVWDVMRRTPQHTYQILTKRHGRMRSLINRWSPITGSPPWVFTGPWPLPNVWLGCSVEDQKWAGIRIPALLDTPAAVRFLSCEPLLGPLDVTEWLHESVCPIKTEDVCTCDPADCEVRVDWLIVGGESGSGARPMHPDWARSLRDQCTVAGVPFHFKQWGEWSPRNEPWRSATYDSRPAVWITKSGTTKPWGEFTGNEPFATKAMYRVGKKAAGRYLDGCTWDEFPAVSS
jgi:protein gp37